MSKNPAPRKHHYLPQFYLRRFSVAGAGLYQIAKADGRIMPVKIKDVAAMRDFHILDDDDTVDEQALEKKLAEVEGEMAPHLEHFLGGGFHHLPTQLYVKQLLSMLRMRVPAVRDHLQESMADVVYERLKMLEAKGKLAPSPPGLEEALKVENLMVEIKNRALMEKMFGLVASEDVLEIYYSMQPTLLHAPFGTRFITSDQPVALFHPEASARLGVGPEDPDVVISLPLSSRSALLLSHSELTNYRGTKFRQDVERVASQAEVHEINRRTAMMAQTWIFTGEDPAALLPMIASTRGYRLGMQYTKVETRGGVGFLMQNIAVGPARSHDMPALHKETK